MSRPHLAICLLITFVLMFLTTIVSDAQLYGWI